ncbi:hypothetical protein QAD02_021076 [Eretmocerus hayati]|uniref:Uncharacterized protein n=1 Tax=Eretmocerus hayati TaxID=131215 RepID=A0ACC2PP95_9HYME|nr:hypothetical protein QAD02_021076 [Eretmocerus hayati]
MPHIGMAVAEAYRQMCHGTPYASWANVMVPPPSMEGWTFPLIWNLPMLPPAFSSAQIHEIRDSSTETDARARASNSNDGARAHDALGIPRDQRDFAGRRGEKPEDCINADCTGIVVVEDDGKAHLKEVVRETTA